MVSLRGDRKYNTKLTAAEEKEFLQWKLKYAPKDAGLDYDLRGAFKAGLTPDNKTHHWLDTFKKPTHPTFSDESQYSTRAYPGGHWIDDQYVPSRKPKPRMLPRR